MPDAGERVSGAVIGLDADRWYTKEICVGCGCLYWARADHHGLTCKACASKRNGTKAAIKRKHVLPAPLPCLPGHAHIWEVSNHNVDGRETAVCKVCHNPAVFLAEVGNY